MLAVTTLGFGMWLFIVFLTSTFVVLVMAAIVDGKHRNTEQGFRIQMAASQRRNEALVEDVARWKTKYRIEKAKAEGKLID